MEKMVGMIVLTLQRLSLLKEYELELITKDEAIKNLKELTSAMKQIGELK